ncbi:hypothetical protein L2E82_22104, partial [Cichorium intybus]
CSPHLPAGFLCPHRYALSRKIHAYTLLLQVRSALKEASHRPPFTDSKIRQRDLHQQQLSWLFSCSICCSICCSFTLARSVAFWKFYCSICGCCFSCSICCCCFLEFLLIDLLLLFF